MTPCATAKKEEALVAGDLEKFGLEPPAEGIEVGGNCDRSFSTMAEDDATPLTGQGDTLSTSGMSGPDGWWWSGASPCVAPKWGSERCVEGPVGVDSALLSGLFTAEKECGAAVAAGGGGD